MYMFGQRRQARWTHLLHVPTQVYAHELMESSLVKLCECNKAFSCFALILCKPAMLPEAVSCAWLLVWSRWVCDCVSRASSCDRVWLRWWWASFRDSSAACVCIHACIENLYVACMLCIACVYICDSRTRTYNTLILFKANIYVFIIDVYTYIDRSTCTYIWKTCTR